MTGKALRSHHLSTSGEAVDPSSLNPWSSIFPPVSDFPPTMATGHQVDQSWMWHPGFTETRTDTAGLFVRFRTEFTLDHEPPSSLMVHITADTRYRLFVNNDLAGFGPVKGDSALWFYDEVDVSPYLHKGPNKILVVVLRFFYSTRYACAFPRLPFGGLRIQVPSRAPQWAQLLDSGKQWETTIDESTILRVDEPEDDFLHIYERSDGRSRDVGPWLPAKLYEFQISTGNSVPWKLSPRMIPDMKRNKAYFSAVHNVRSSIEKSAWEAKLVGSSPETGPLRLPPSSKHEVDLEVPHHMTAFVSFRFRRLTVGGGRLVVMYSESYEDEPTRVPYLRKKTDRRDTTKSLYGPSDEYRFVGAGGEAGLWDQQAGEEVFMPFHFRTFRYLRVTIEVGGGRAFAERL